MTTEHPLFDPAPKLFVAVIDRNDSKRLEAVLAEKRAHFHFICNGMGTASSELLGAFGLSGSEKSVCLCIEPAGKAQYLLSAVAERMELVRPGNGIAFLMPVSGISASISNAFSEELQQYKERLDRWMDMEAEKTASEARYELVVAVINQGYSEDVMHAAKAAGAKGGTIINARRSGGEDSARFLGISLQSEKEIVTILIPHSQKMELMQAISKKCGMRTEAHGIIISLPVESCAGLGLEDKE